MPTACDSFPSRIMTSGAVQMTTTIVSTRHYHLPSRGATSMRVCAMHKEVQKIRETRTSGIRAEALLGGLGALGELGLKLTCRLVDGEMENKLIYI
jgi:hypothetical protein